MKRSDSAVETVLAGLRGVEAPVGMERRILGAVEARAAEQRRVGWHPLKPGRFFARARRVSVRSLAGGVALTGVAAVALMLIANRRLEPAPVRPTPDRVRMEVKTPAPPQVIAEGAQSLTLEPGVGSVRRTGLRRVGVSVNGDSLALREMRAVSHPAPPLPLTEQERLLVRIAETGSPQEIALLNPEMRAKEEAKEEAEFQRALEPPKIDIQ